MIRLSHRPLIRLKETGFLSQNKRSFSLAKSNSNTHPFGHREKLAEQYLQQREWTIERLLQNRRALKEHTGFARQLQVNWVHKNDFVSKAVEDMVSKDIGSLLVYDDIVVSQAERSTNIDNNENNKKFLGIITERDFLRKVLGENLLPNSTTCGTIMTPRKSLSVVTLDHTLYECLHIFEKGEFRHLPVVSPRGDLGPEEEDVLAVLSQRDLVHEFRKFHETNLKYIESFVDFPIW
jgi:CBS domain-containing protein